MIHLKIWKDLNSALTLIMSKYCPFQNHMNICLTKVMLDYSIELHKVDTY